MSAKHPLVRGLKGSADGVALVAGAVDESPTLYLAANGCRVTALDEEPEAVDRVMHAALRAGLTDRIDARVGGLESWSPDSPLFAVIVSDAALSTLTLEERARVLAILQRATIDGGVHLVQALAGHEGESLNELRKLYRGWSVQVDESAANAGAFLATKDGH
jgi:cyclopropane fatty-acyl-phospholipid synthase-like methyltransferase